MKGTEKIPTEFDKNEEQKRVFVFDFTKNAFLKSYFCQKPKTSIRVLIQR